jgi:hypothetical protein
MLAIFYAVKDFSDILNQKAFKYYYNNIDNIMELLLYIKYIIQYRERNISF